MSFLGSDSLLQGTGKIRKAGKAKLGQNLSHEGFCESEKVDVQKADGTQTGH